MRPFSICVLLALCVLLVQQSFISCKLKFNPNRIKENIRKVPFGNTKKTIKEHIREFFRKIKVPTYISSISKKVCPRRPSLLISTQVTQLKKSLQSTAHRKPGQCTRRQLWSFRKKTRHMGVVKPTVEGEFSRPSRCNIRQMTLEEKKARNDLQPRGIGKHRICVRKEGSCQEQGKVDQNTRTLNMCHSCRFTVYIPENFFPNSFIHFQCGNGEDISCLMSEGACKKRQLRHHIKGINNRHAVLTITTGCACEILEDSIFKTFVK